MISTKHSALRLKQSHILLDSYKSHNQKEVLASFSLHYKTTVGVVSGGMTPLLHGMDTHINWPLKADLRKRYKEFMRSEDVEYTRFGNKKGPSYQQLIDMCSAAWHSLDKDIVRASFYHTGVTLQAENVDEGGGGSMH